MVAQRDEGGEQRDDPEQGPHQLADDVEGRVLGVHRLFGEVEPVDHDQPDAVEQRGAWQQVRVGIRRENAHRGVGDRKQPEVAREQPQQVDGDRLLQRHHRHRGGEADDDHCEQQKAELAPAASYVARLSPLANGIQHVGHGLVHRPAIDAGGGRRLRVGSGGGRGRLLVRRGIGILGRFLCGLVAPAVLRWTFGV